MDHPNLSNALKLNETEGLKQTIEQVGAKAQKFVDSQKKQIHVEDDLSENVFEYMHTVYFVIFVQVLVIISLAGYQIFSFRKVILNQFFY